MNVAFIVLFASMVILVGFVLPVMINLLRGIWMKVKELIGMGLCIVFQSLSILLHIGLESGMCTP